MNMKQLIFITAFFGFSFIANAQQGFTKTSLQQATVMPIGNFSNFIKVPSARGVTGSLDYFISSSISAGISAGYYDLYDKKDRATYKINGLDVSAVKSHSVQLIPVLVRGGYNWFKEESAFQPYINVSTGVNFINYQEWYGTLIDEQNRVRLAIAPEIGSRIAFNKRSMLGADVSLRYNYTAFKYNNVKNIQTISLNIGLFWFNRD